MLNSQEFLKAARAEGRVSRRLFLAYSAALATLPQLASRTAAEEKKVRFDADPFTLGVASGDPEATSVVLWTRLAPKPADPDGGMKPEAVNVQWEIAEDDAMKKVVAKGQSVATPQLGHSVHTLVAGLKPDRWYWYRFTVGDAQSPVGKTRTLPAADVMPEKLKFAFASCQNYEQGLYTAYEQMAKDDVDLVFHLGDYIYEYPARKNLVRKHNGPTEHRLKTLEDYRLRFVQYRHDPLLHNMHAQCPWFVTWDDHEFENNYASDISEIKGTDPAEFLIQRAAAYQAYYEMMPLRPRSLPQGPDMRIYRKAAFGRLAELIVLDTRQYRTDQPNGDGLKPLNEEALKPTNTLLGKKQRNWLDATLINSKGNWNILAQQVMMAMNKIPLPEGQINYAMDQWPGAAHERMALLRFIADRKIPNPVVLTGDIHSNWVNELRVDDREADQPVVATEFVGTSISSGGNGKQDPEAMEKLQALNPGVKYFSFERGYVRCTVTPDQWQSDYIAVEDVTKPGGKTVNRVSFVVESGKPGAEKA